MAVELRVGYFGDGKFRASTMTDLIEANSNLKAGRTYKASLTEPKTDEQNNYLHVLCQIAFDNQRTGIKLPTWKHLRNHLLVRADYCFADVADLKGVPPEMVTRVLAPTVKAMRRFSDTIFINYDPKTESAIVRAPKSWSVATMEEASEALDKIVAIITTEFVPGLDLEALRLEAKERIAKKRPKGAA